MSINYSISLQNEPYVCQLVLFHCKRINISGRQMKNWQTYEPTAYPGVPLVDLSKCRFKLFLKSSNFLRFKLSFKSFPTFERNRIYHF